MILISTEVASYRAYLTLANFKTSTVSAYCRTLEKFYQFHLDRHANKVPTQEDVQSYLLQRRESGVSWSSINCDYSALRKYFKALKDYEWSLKKMPRPKRDKVLPRILSKEQVAMLISCAPTLKYQTFLTLLYATGMRLSEATHIRLSDIDSDRIQIRIDLGKGGKSRMVQMPASLLELLRSYYKAYKPEIYLFNGNKKGKVYSSSSARWAIRRAIKLSGKEIRCNLHMLRNCYATHHLELGTDLVYLQEQMGHKHLKTTAKYIRLCVDRYRRIVHPIDAMARICYA